MLAVVAALYSTANYSSTRPFPKDSIQNANSICRTWSQNSKTKGIKQLVMTFEGLAAFKKKGAKNVYRYYSDLKKGIDKKPAGVSMAFVADNLVIKNLNKNYHKNEFLNMSHGSDEVAYACLKSWIKTYGKSLDLVLVGHSFGGNAIKRIMNNLLKDFPQFKIKGMLSIDPRLKNKFVTAPNVKKHFVFYQKGFLRGYPYKDPRGEGFTFNRRVRGKDISGPEGNNHANLTLFREVQDTYNELLF